MRTIDMILDMIEKEHPYKVPGDRDTYGKYNEGWSDAIDRVLGALQVMNSEPFEFYFSSVKSFKCRCGQKYINTGIEADGWIPVEEQLPEKEYSTVLCVTDKKHYFVGVYNRKKRFLTGDIYAEGEVIAWMPLELYRPERSEEK